MLLIVYAVYSEARLFYSPLRLPFHQLINMFQGHLPLPVVCSMSLRALGKVALSNALRQKHGIRRLVTSGENPGVYLVVLGILSASLAETGSRVGSILLLFAAVLGSLHRCNRVI